MAITIGAQQGAGDQVASGESVSITVPSGTTLLLVGSAFWGAATAASVSDWSSGTEVFTQLVFDNGSGLGGDMAGAIWALANPTAKTNTITVTVTGGSNHQSVMAVAVSGTADGSTTLSDAVVLAGQVNNESETSTLAFNSAGFAEEALLAFVWWLGDDQEGITNNASFTQLLEGATSAGADGPGNSDNTYHCAWLQDGAPTAVTFTSGASADENIGFSVRLKPAPVGASSFIGGATGESTSSTTVSVTHGLTILENDVIVAVVNENFISAGATHSDNNGANSFTAAFQEDHPDIGGSDSHYSIWTRVAGSSEPSSYSFSSSSTNNSGKQLVVYQLRGIDTSNIWDVAPSASTRNFATQGSPTTTATTPNATNSGVGNIGLAIFTNDGSSTFSAYTQSFTDEIEDATPTRGVAIVSREYTTTGTKTGPQATLSSSEDHVSHHLILNTLSQSVVTHLTSLADTGGAPNTSSSFTPTAGSLLLVLVTSANSDDLTGVTLTSSESLTFTILPQITQFHSGNWSAVYGFVSDDFASAVSQTVTFDQTTDPADGTVISVYEITGLFRTGLSAIRQAKNTTDGSNSGTTPAITFDNTCLIQNPTIAMVGNRSNPAGLTPPTGWTEDADVGETTPDFGAEVVSRQTGFTGTTITWGATSASNWGVLAVEINTAAIGPTITDVANSGETPGSGTETWQDGSTGNVITGTGFI